MWIIGKKTSIKGNVWVKKKYLCILINNSGISSVQFYYEFFFFCFKNNFKVVYNSFFVRFVILHRFFVLFFGVWGFCMWKYPYKPYILPVPLTRSHSPLAYKWVWVTEWVTVFIFIRVLISVSKYVCLSCIYIYKHIYIYICVCVCECECVWVFYTLNNFIDGCWQYI